MVKDGSVFDNLSQINTIVFDKTGTLTLEQPAVSQLHVLAPWREDELLTLAAAAEIHQTHPIARAIRTAAAERKLTLPTIDHAHYEVGYGIKVQLPQGFHLAEGFERTLQQNFRFTAGVSVAAVAGVLLAGFTFAATEVLYTVALLGGLGITMKPLLEQQNKATLL